MFARNLDLHLHGSTKVGDTTFKVTFKAKMCFHQNFVYVFVSVPGSSMLLSINMYANTHYEPIKKSSE